MAMASSQPEQDVELLAGHDEEVATSQTLWGVEWCSSLSRPRGYHHSAPSTETPSQAAGAEGCAAAAGRRPGGCWAAAARRAPLAAVCAFAAAGCLAARGLFSWQHARARPTSRRFISAASGASAAQQPAPGGLFDLVAETVEARSEVAAQDSWPSEWEVIYSGGLVNIRQRNTTASEVVRIVKTGTVVLGYERGRWLELSGMDGFIEIRLDSSGYMQGDSAELLRKREVSYLVTEGSCDEESAYDVPDQAICKHAARWLDQPQDALWFKDGCQVDPAPVAASAKKLGEAKEEEEEDEEEEEEENDDGQEGKDEEEQPEEEKAEEDEADEAEAAEEAAEEVAEEASAGPEPPSQSEPPPPQAAEEAAEDPPASPAEPKAAEEGHEPLAGRRLGSHGGHHEVTSKEEKNGQGGGESWAEFAKRKKFLRICSTAPYQADKPFPVNTHTSVTSFTTTTTQTVSSLTTATTGTLKEKGWPSLFCFAVFRANTAEQDLVKEACRLQAGVFACDTTVTVSGEKIWVGKDYKHRDVWSWVNQVDEVTMGDIANNPGETTNSWLNTQIFINAIKMLVDNGIMWEHDWTVKGDPDAVLFPDRIRTHIIASGTTGTPAFYENCFHDGQWWLYGSIEMFSKEAMFRYRDAGERECEWGMQWQGWGEDMYMAECMHRLGAAAVQSMSLVADHYCSPRDCSDGEVAAFHPFKTKDDWRGCLEASTGMSFPAEGDLP